MFGDGSLGCAMCLCTCELFIVVLQTMLRTHCVASPASPFECVAASTCVPKGQRDPVVRILKLTSGKMHKQEKAKGWHLHILGPHQRCT